MGPTRRSRKTFTSSRKYQTVSAFPLKRLRVPGPSARRSATMARALFSLSAAETSRERAGLPGRDAMYASLRGRQSGFTFSKVSVQSSTIFATSSPKRARILASLGRPPWSSAASCSRAAMAWGSSPPKSSTVPAVPRRCAA